MKCVRNCECMKRVSPNKWYCTFYEVPLNTVNDSLYRCRQCEEKEILLLERKIKEFEHHYEIFSAFMEANIEEIRKILESVHGI